MTRRPAPPVRLVAGASLALFLLVFALLVFQLRSGRDPALGGAVAAVQATPPPPKRVLVRKLIITRVIVHLPAEDEARPATGVSAPAPAAPAPVSHSAPAVTQAPAVVRAPAPAPAPAPLTTRSS